MVVSDVECILMVELGNSQDIVRTWCPAFGFWRDGNGLDIVDVGCTGSMGELLDSVSGDPVVYEIECEVIRRNLVNIEPCMRSIISMLSASS